MKIEDYDMSKPRNRKRMRAIRRKSEIDISEFPRSSSLTDIITCCEKLYQNQDKIDPKVCPLIVACKSGFWYLAARHFLFKVFSPHNFLTSSEFSLALPITLSTPTPKPIFVIFVSGFYCGEAALISRPPPQQQQQQQRLGTSSHNIF